MVTNVITKPCTNTRKSPFSIVSWARKNLWRRDGPRLALVMTKKRSLPWRRSTHLANRAKTCTWKRIFREKLKGSLISTPDPHKNGWHGTKVRIKRLSKTLQWALICLGSSQQHSDSFRFFHLFIVSLLPCLPTVAQGWFVRVHPPQRRQYVRRDASWFPEPFLTRPSGYQWSPNRKSAAKHYVQMCLPDEDYISPFAEVVLRKKNRGHRGRWWEMGNPTLQTKKKLLGSNPNQCQPVSVELRWPKKGELLTESLTFDNQHAVNNTTTRQSVTRSNNQPSIRPFTKKPTKQLWDKPRHRVAINGGPLSNHLTIHFAILPAPACEFPQHCCQCQHDGSQLHQFYHANSHLHVAPGASACKPRGIFPGYHWIWWKSFKWRLRSEVDAYSLCA